MACQEEFEKRGGYEMEARIRRVVRGLRLPEDVPDRPFADLSGGEKTKVGLAQVLLSEPDLLLLDEPTNHLDLSALEWLEELLSQWRGAVVVVSHDRYFLDRVVNRIIDLEDGRSTLYQGNYSLFVEGKRTAPAGGIPGLPGTAEENQKDGGSHQAVAGVGQPFQPSQRRPSPEGLQHGKGPQADGDAKAAGPGAEKNGPELRRPRAERGDLCSGSKTFIKHYGREPVLRGANLVVRSGERVAVVGKNGAGKSTLLRLLTGEIAPDRGEVYVGPSVKAGYLSQQGWEGDPDMTVLEAFRRRSPLRCGHGPADSCPVPLLRPLRLPQDPGSERR